MLVTKGMLRKTRYDLLYKSIPTTPSVIVLLKLDKLELAEGLEHVLQVLFRDAEVNVAYIQPVEGNRVGVARAVSRAYLAVLLGLGELDNDRDT